MSQVVAMKGFHLKLFNHKFATTQPYNLTYSYYLSPGFQSSGQTDNQTTLVFAHGFPDDAFMWEETLTYFRHDCRIIVLDMLGFGGSSKPTEWNRYNCKQQADSIAQILDIEGVKNSVIPIGHDWGSTVMQRFYLYHRHLCIGLVLISIAYKPPRPTPFDLDVANSLSKQAFGYAQFEYWNFLTSPDAPALMEHDLERFFDVMNGFLASSSPAENGRDVWMREMFCVAGAMRDYIQGQGKYKDFTVALKPYPNGKQVRQRFLDRLSRDGLQGGVGYYQAYKRNTMLEGERLLCQSSERSEQVIRVPLLYIGQTGDWVCRTDQMTTAKEVRLVPELEETVIDAGHWVLYEKPKEVAMTIQDWLSRLFP